MNLDLSKAGDSATTPPFTKAVITVGWKTNRDMDLFVLGEDKDGANHRLAFFKDLGSDGDPIHHHGDEGVGDTASRSADDMGFVNQEDVTVNDPNKFKAIHCFLLDYTSVQGGKPSNIKDAGVEMYCVTDDGSKHHFTVDSGGLGGDNNAIAVASIQTGGEFKFINDSKGAYWKSLPTDIAPFLALAGVS
jgi:hypothetical protein